MQYETDGKKSHDFTDNYPACDVGLECMAENDQGLGSVVDGTCQSAFCEGTNNHVDHNIPSDSIRVTICHRTCSERNPWVRITIDDDAWNGTQASGCGHQNHHVENCTGKDWTKWGSHQQDYLLKWHGYKSQHDKDYWDNWEPACPYVRSNKEHNPCCNRTAGECCGDPPPPEPKCEPPAYSNISSSCLQDIKVLEKIGNSVIGSNPIIISNYTDDFVTFAIKRQWDSNGTVYVQYFDPQAEQYYCVEACEGTSIRAHCLTTVPIAIIEIWVETGIETDNANISTCCFEKDFVTTENIEASTGTEVPPINTTGKHYIEGTYEIWCTSKCNATAGSA